MTKWIIYTLANPRTNEVRYVGWTSQRANRRLSAHLQEAVSKTPTTYRTKWILSLLSIGLRPVMETIESGSGDGWAEAEQRWIATYRERGARLTNATDGGEGTVGWIPTAAEKEARSRRGKANSAKYTAEHMAAWRAGALRANLGSTRKPEHIAAIRAANTGRIRSPETLAKISAVHKGKTVSPEARAKMSASAKVKIFTPEHRLRMSLAHIGKRHSAESIKKMSAARIGIPRPPHVVEKAAATRRRNNAIRKNGGAR